MAKLKNIIDSELILKKINNTITEEEDNLFQSWYNESTEHQEYFLHAKAYFERGSAFDIEPLDANAAWNKISVTTSTSNKSGKNRFLTLGISIAAAIALVVATVFLFQELQEDAQPVLTKKVNEILPGQSKATLILDDGSSYDLSQGANVRLRSGKTLINSEGAKIKYTTDEIEQSVTKYNTLMIPKGGEYLVELSDGTKVWLNAATTLKYPVQFVGDERNVELTGEAYFEVAHNASKPFHVISGGQSLEVLGTEFNVSAYKDDSHIVTTLVKGKVSVYGTITKANQQILLPNQQTTMNRSSGEITSKTVDPTNFIAWKSGAFYFQDKTFDGMMKVLSRWYNIDVFYENEAVRSIRFTGRFKRYDDFETVKKLIEKTDEVKFKIDNKTVIIK
ncbi:FecR domain-containing protein [Reichenbachiella sp. MALMAid0571]|uniref:FecR family protein n=1 Tax=Reichenbachiella sp. MALMAid0571 TaxID=3143939 RepID=UPI0032DFED01